MCALFYAARSESAGLQLLCTAQIYSLCFPQRRAAMALCHNRWEAARKGGQEWPRDASPLARHTLWGQARKLRQGAVGGPKTACLNRRRPAARARPFGGPGMLT